MTTTSDPLEPRIILIAGHWLGAWAWDEVMEALSSEHCSATALTLPGLDPRDPSRSSRTLDDQAAAIEEAVAQAADGQAVILVAHSGANAPVSLVLDRHPERIARVVWVDSGPAADGGASAPEAHPIPDELPLPPFDVLQQQASLEGLSAEALDRFRSLAVPEPGSVLRQPVRLSDEARWRVPSTFICCSMSSAQLRELVDARHPMFAEVAELRHWEAVDLPTGHWPMWSRPDDLADAIRAAARR